MKKEKFLEIFEINRQEALSKNEKAAIVSNNGTSESVLQHLRSLNDPDTMNKTVDELSCDMYATYQEVYGNRN
jgi:hypothetical protein